MSILNGQAGGRGKSWRVPAGVVLLGAAAAWSGGQSLAPAGPAAAAPYVLVARYESPVRAWAPGEIVREIVDPHNGDRWLLMSKCMPAGAGDGATR